MNMYLKKSALCLPIFALLSTTLHAQIVTNGTTGGLWNDNSTWATAVPATNQNFSILATDTVTANNLGTIQSNNSNSNVFGTLSIGSGTTLSMARLNNGVTSSGTLNINGGDMSISRFSQSAGSNFTLNINSGSFTIRDAIAVTNSTYTINLSGGLFDFNHGSLGGGTLNISGGTFLMRASLSGSGSLNSGTWNGGAIATAGTVSNATASTTLVTKWSSNPTNILRASTTDSAQTLTLISNSIATQGILSLSVYSGGSNDNDQLAVSGTNTLSLSSDVVLDISGISLAGAPEDYIGSSYQFFQASNYGSISATVNDTIFNIGGTDYEVSWINTLNSNGTLTIGSIAVPEPSTYALITGILLLGFVCIKRRSRKSSAK